MGILVVGLELKATKRIREFGGVTQVWRWGSPNHHSKVYSSDIVKIHH